MAAICAAVLIALLVQMQAGGTNADHRSGLLKYLLCDYDVMQRPTADEKTVIKVTLRITPLSVVVEDEDDVLLMEMRTMWMWTDEFLRWDPSQHNDIQGVTLHSSKIWLPKVSMKGWLWPSEVSPTGRCATNSSGVVYCFGQQRPAIRCTADVYRWPADWRICYIKAESSPYVNVSLIVHKEYLKKSTNSDLEWSLEKIQQEDGYILYFQRKSSGHFVIVRIPAIVLGIIIGATLLCDPASTGRLILACMNIIGFLFCIFYIGDMLPSSHTQIPQFLLVYTNSMWLALVTVVETILVRNMSSVTWDPPAFILLPTDWIKSNCNKLFNVTFKDSEEEKNNEMMSTWVIFAYLLDIILLTVSVVVVLGDIFFFIF